MQSFREEISTKYLVIMGISLLPMIGFSALVVLMLSGILDGEVPIIAYIVLVGLWSMMYFIQRQNIGKKVVLSREGVLQIPHMYFCGNMRNTFFVSEHEHRRFPVFIFSLDNIAAIYRTRVDRTASPPHTYFHVHNPDKAVCIEFREPLPLHLGLVGMKVGVPDLPVSSVYVSVAHPEKLIATVQKAMMTQHHFAPSAGSLSRGE